MPVISVETLEELKYTWLRRITFIFHRLNFDANTDLILKYIEYSKYSRTS